MVTTSEGGASGPGAGIGATRRKARGPAAGTKPGDTRGGVFERRVARLEFAEGALSRLRVPVSADDAEPGRDILTDLDILSVEVDLRLRLTRSSVECKSGTGQSGEPQTIIWLAGLSQLLNLHRTAIARTTFSSRGRALARRLGIAVLDEATIADREKAHQWLPERFAHLDGSACTQAESRTDTQLKGLPGIPAPLAHFLRNGSLLASSPELLAAVESYGKAATTQGVLPEPAATVLSSHALIAVILAALQDAGRLDDVNARELRLRLERALTVGDPEDDRLLPLLERADALVRHVVNRTHRAYVEAGAEPIGIEMPSLRDTVAVAPHYLDDYLDFVERMRNNPLVARDLLQTAELACFEAALGGSEWAAPAFSHLFTAEHKALLMVGLRCLTTIAGPQVTSPLHRVRELATSGAATVPDRHAAASSPHSANEPSAAAGNTSGAEPPSPAVLDVTLEGL